MATPNNFVDHLVKDPAEVPDLILLNGFVGPSSLEGHTRLYLNVVLSEYYEISHGAVLHSAPADSTADNPLATTFLWVKADAELIRKGKGTSERKVKFLCGDIQAAGNAAPSTPNGAVVGPTGIENCTATPAQCGGTAWKDCPG